MQIIKKVICIKGNGMHVKKGKTYDVIEEHENEYRIISNESKWKPLYPYIHKARFNDL